MNSKDLKQLTWFFDLDKTLYPPNNGLFHKGNRRINDYFQQKLNKPLPEVNKLRLHFMHKYGTSLLGGIREFNFNAKDFLKYVHGFPKNQYVSKEPELKNFIKNLPGRKFIFSNAPKYYIEEILNHLGIKESFIKIYGIESYRNYGKPNPSSYTLTLRWTHVMPAYAILVDDSKVNCTAAQKLGLNTIWIDENQPYNNYYRDVLFPTITSFLENQL